MTKTITPNDIIRYLYQETSEEENVTIQVKKICDNDFAEYVEPLEMIHQKMNKIQYQPSHKSIQNILEYSQKKNLQFI